MEPKEIPGYQGRYLICEDGTVISQGGPRTVNGRWGTMTVNPPTRVLRPALASNGYWFVSLYRRDDGRRSVNGYLHRLVAQAFVPNPDGLPEINHEDGDKANNAASNLSWVTKSQNHLHRTAVLGKNSGETHYRARLTEDDVRAIRESTETGAALAKRYGVSQGNITAIRKRRSWKYVH